LESTNLEGTNLRRANLSGVDLSGADLRSADLRGADLDFSSLPVWCGGQGAKIDSKLAKQFLAHALAFECDDPEYQRLKKEAREFCSESHIAEHIDWLNKENSK